MILDPPLPDRRFLTGGIKRLLSQSGGFRRQGLTQEL